MLSAWLGGLAAAVLIAPGPQCGLTTLPGLSRQYSSMIRVESGLPPAGRAADFSRVAESILGETTSDGVDWATRTDLPCDAGVRQRDRVAWQMAMVGHSAKEIADVLDGHLTIADLNRAQARLMAGQSRVRVADFLDARWRELVPTAMPATAIAFRPTRRDVVVPVAATLAARAVPVVAMPVPIDLDAELVALADRHRVPPALVRAMVAAESGGNARAQSSAGAIGLMQLMPATAAALGVDPWQPRENLRGGITYLGGLLREYGENTRLALIAYNAGPQHANRVRAGSAVAYRETRKYLDAIAAHYPLP